MSEASGFGFWVPGFRGPGSRFGVSSSEFVKWGLGFGFRIRVPGFPGLGFPILGSGFQVSDVPYLNGAADTRFEIGNVAHEAQNRLFLKPFFKKSQGNYVCDSRFEREFRDQLCSDP